MTFIDLVKKRHSVRDYKDLPENLEVIALLPIGYPLENKEPEKKRKDMVEIVSWEGYSQG